jgi:two-component system chemotaxis response regulator CheB
VYLAPADRHLLIRTNRVRVVRGPRENRFRPAVDPLFRTAAEHYGPRVIGIVLSGALDDGTHGLELIKRHGGLAIAQDPNEAAASGMPLSAIQNVEIDHVLRVAEIARRLPPLIGETVAAIRPAGARGEPDVAEGTARNGPNEGRPSDLTCPECGGSLRELEGGTVLRYRCHVGHGYTADSLFADQSDGLENAFWGALRALEEHSMLRRRMSDYAFDAGRRDVARAFEREARTTELRASVIRRLLHTDRPGRIDGAPAASTKRRKPSAAIKQRPGTRTRRVNR